MVTVVDDGSRHLHAELNLRRMAHTGCRKNQARILHRDSRYSVALNCDTSSNRRPASFTEQSHLARQGRGGWRRGTHTGSRLRRLGDTERVPATGSGLAELHGGRGDGEPPPQPPSRGHGETAGGGDERGTVPRDGDGDRAGRGERPVRARGGGGDCCGDGGQLHGRRGAEESEADDSGLEF